ncbi:MAG: nickel pincer cofactor biosynthesis protein LarC [Gemmatimonadetes bacterium]|nr:nickel pincer cofactor biosynthesis protein LarC [Gemmatimonadota bacterium]
MRIAIIDAAAGVSGDMLLGALIGAGADRTALESLPRRTGFPEVGVRIRQVSRGGVSAVKVDFAIPTGGPAAHSHHVRDLVERVRNADVGSAVRDRAIRAFELIGAAEGRVHGVAPDHVHLHEVGAVDAVLDIVGVCELFEHLGVAAVYNFPVAVGSGWVEAAHGRLPVPAPATSLLLEGIEVTSGGPVEGEATTPTGAALLRVLSAGRPPERWRATVQGWGAGSRDPAGYPNALRLLVAEAADEAGEVEVVATDLDDLPPEYVEPLREAVFAAGAVDCVVWPTQGKKGRVALRLEAQVPPGNVDAVVRALFRHSTTTGVRRWRTVRTTLPRRQVEINVAPDVRVRVKVTDAPGGRRYKPEYQDVMTAAARLDVPALEVARQAERQARAADGGAAGRDPFEQGSDGA